MKTGKIRVLALILAIIMTMLTGTTAMAYERYTDYQCELDDGTVISPAVEGTHKPTFYTSAKSMSVADGKTANLSDFSASAIRKMAGTRDYGMYMKITPSKSDSGLWIERLDFVIFSPKAEYYLCDCLGGGVELGYGYQTQLEYVSLQDFFDYMLEDKGEIPTGTYQVDWYINGLYTNTTYLKMNK